ncbi:MAG: hypothetical protein ACHQ51_06370 [Elusimicrobiota bacterium]
MSEPSGGKAAAIADLLNKLADLSGDEAAMEACRREADLFEPDLSTAGIALELYSLEPDAAGRAVMREILEGLRERFHAQGSLPAAARISDGLTAFDAAGRPP